MKAWAALTLGMCAFAQTADDAKWAALADQIRRQGKPVEVEVQDYVRRVASRVAGGETWRVDVMDGGTGEGMFAAWIPGYVFVPGRSLTLAQSESELAAVLAHSMSHRVETNAGIRVAVAEGMQIGEEIRADRLAVYRLVKAGYQPQAMLDCLERMEWAARPERLAELKAVIAAAPKRAESIENTSEFLEMQSRVRAHGPKLPRKAPSLYRNKL